MSRTNPYSDFSDAAYDRTAGVDTRDALVNNQAMETLRRIVWGQEIQKRRHSSTISQEPHIYHRYDRGAFALKQAHSIGSADLLLYASSSTELLSLLKMTSRAELASGEAAPRHNGGTRTIIADPPGVEVSGIARWIPSNTRLVGFTFLDDVDVSGVPPVVITCPSGASFYPATMPYAPVTQNFRPGDWLSLPSRTGGSTLRLVPISQPSVSEIATGSHYWTAAESVADATGQVGCVLKTNIHFESCAFYGKLTLQYSHGCRVNSCVFLNDDFASYSGELELIGYNSVLSTYNDTTLYPAIWNSDFLHIGADISAPMVWFTGNVTGARVINCRFSTVKQLTGATDSLIRWHNGSTMHKGSIMFGCNIGGPVGTIEPPFKDDWTGASGPSPWHFFTMCYGGKNSFPATPYLNSRQGVSY